MTRARTVASISSSGTLTSPTITSPAISNSTDTAPILISPEERVTISATSAATTVNFDADTQGVLYYTSNSSASFALNFRGSSTTTMASKLAINDAFTGVFMVTNGSTGYYATSIQVDGTTSGVSTKWQGGTAPTSGNTSSIDVYSCTIIRTASSAYTVLASQTKFA
jgi:hypothetical protein